MRRTVKKVIEVEIEIDRDVESDADAVREAHATLKYLVDSGAPFGAGYCKVRVTSFYPHIGDSYEAQKWKVYDEAGNDTEFNTNKPARF